MPHLAAPRLTRRPAIVLLAAGLVAIVAGVAVLAVGFAPFFGWGGETSTVVAPPTQASSVGPGDSLDIRTAIQGVMSAADSPALLDHPVNGIDFEMSVPSLGYRASVREGVGSDVLMKGPGHYPTTPWPGRAGNVGVAAHNVYWLSFSRLKAGDQVQFQTRRGLFIYEITGSKIVEPDDRTVLAPTTDHRLTLTTCWPLWAGAYATQRLIFFAKEIGGVE